MNLANWQNLPLQGPRLCQFLPMATSFTDESCTRNWWVSVHSSCLYKHIFMCFSSKIYSRPCPDSESESTSLPMSNFHVLAIELNIKERPANAMRLYDGKGIMRRHRGTLSAVPLTAVMARPLPPKAVQKRCLPPSRQASRRYTYHFCL